MGQTQAPKRGTLQAIGYAPQGMPKSRTAPDKLIVSREDLDVNHNPYGQSLQQTAQITLCVRPHMGAEAPSPSLRQVVDQRNIAKVIAPSPIFPVRFKRIEAVRRKDHQPPSQSTLAGLGGSQHSHCIGDGLPVISDMLDHFVTQN